MELLQTFDVVGAGRIELCVGDLAAMAGEDAVDLLVVSAFPDDYVPTPGSLVGALADLGVSVGELAADKLDDLRATSDCWLSHPLAVGQDTVGFRQILCYEPRRPVGAAETVGNVFRAMVPFVGETHGVHRVAMPILATGDQGQSISKMLPAILEAATGWMGIKLPLALLRIVVRPGSEAAALHAWDAWSNASKWPQPSATTDRNRPFDAFVSYARDDATDVADQIVDEILSLRPSAKVFLDRNQINPGASWQQKIYDCLDRCRKVVVLITPGFLQSKVCEEELNIARLRDRESDAEVLYPLYVREAALEDRPHIRILTYIDCCEADPAALRRACESLVQQLEAGDHRA